MASAALTAPGQPALFVERRGLLTLAVMAAMVMQILDTTIANVALPHMQTSLGATIDTVTWVLTSYLVATAIAIPTTGWLADRFGSRNLFLGAVGGFIIASMLCGTAVSLEEMVLFRILQGACAAFIGPLSQTVMLDINPPERQAKAMAIWGMGVMVGPIMGPVLGGWLTESYNWRWVFYVNLPIGILTLALLWWLLPSRPRQQRRFDLFGFSMLALAVASLQLMLDRGQTEDWLTSWEVIVEAGVAAAAGWMFVVHMFTARQPLFSRDLFRNRNLVTGMFLMILIGITMMAPVALLPPMLQSLFGYPVMDTGLLLASRGVGTVITMYVAAELIGKIDPRVLIGVGLVISAIALWQMSQWTLEMGWRPFVISGFVQGFGVGLVFMPLTAMAFATLAPHWRTDGSSLMTLFRSIGGSMGISGVTTLLARNLQTSHADLVGHVTSFSLSSIDPASADQLGPAGQAGMAMADALVNQQALMIAYLNNFHLLIFVTLAALPFLLLLKRPARLVIDKPVHLE